MVDLEVQAVVVVKAMKLAETEAVAVVVAPAAVRS